MTTIWIVRKHPRHPFSSADHISAFEIFSTHATKAEAKAVCDKKNSNPNTYALYSVGKVTLKSEAQ